VPFTRLPEFTGAISSVSGNVITFSGTPFSVNQYVYNAGANQHKTYFVLIGPHASSNPNEGRFYTITSNTTNTLTVNLNGDSISGVQSTTQALVIPYVTVGFLFPSSDVNVSFIPSPNAISRQTQLFLPNYSGSGINLASSVTYFYSGTTWHTTADTGGDHTDDILIPDGYFTQRNPGTATNLTSIGAVLTKKQTIPLLTSASHKSDNFVSMTRPIDVSLNNSGLIASGAFASSPNAIARTDELFVYNNAAIGINKASSATYFYSGGLWHTTADTSGDHGNDLIPAGTGFIIRKGTTGAGATQFWTNAPTY
jgi:uncharacterized protein (TIGR02597 family)